MIEYITKTWEQAGYTNENQAQARAVKVRGKDTVNQGAERENEKRYREEIDDGVRRAVDNIHYAISLISGFLGHKTLDPNYSKGHPAEEFSTAQKVIIKTYYRWADFMQKKSPVTFDLIRLMGEGEDGRGISFDMAGKRLLLTHRSAKELLNMGGETYSEFHREIEKEIGKKRPLSPRQKQIYDFYTGYFDRTGMKPKYELLQEKFGIGKSAVAMSITEIRNKNWII